MLNRKEIISLLIAYIEDEKEKAWEHGVSYFDPFDDLRDEARTWGQDIGLSEEEMVNVMTECFGED